MLLNPNILQWCHSRIFCYRILSTTKTNRIVKYPVFTKTTRKGKTVSCFDDSRSCVDFISDCAVLSNHFSLIFGTQLRVFMITITGSWWYSWKAVSKDASSSYSDGIYAKY